MAMSQRQALSTRPCRSLATCSCHINASISLILYAADLDDTLERRLLMILLAAADMLACKLSPIGARGSFR
jgi:hypothetical protein